MTNVSAPIPGVIRPVVLCGPSGAGKSTLLKRVIAQYPDDFGFSVSHTTRGARVGEVDGVDYRFVKRTNMEDLMAKNEFIETASVHNNLYGTSYSAVEDVLDKGKICILDIDVQGVQSVHKSKLHVTRRPLYLFVSPPSIDALKTRLVGRATDSEEVINTRLQNAIKEMAFKERSDLFDYVIINDDLEKATEELKAILLKDIENRQKHKHEY